MDMYEKRVRLRELMAAPECVPVLGAYDLLSAKLIEATGLFETKYNTLPNGSKEMVVRNKAQ